MYNFFRLLRAVMKVHPVPYVIFETARSGFIQILHHCSLSSKITPLYFLGQTSCTKIAHWIEISDHLSDWMKSHQIPHVIFETTCQFFLKLCIILQCHEKQVFCTSLAETLYEFYKSSPPKCKISDVQLHRWNFTKFVLW